MNRPFNVAVALPRGPEHYWKVARSFGPQGFTVGDLAGCTNGVAYSTVRRWIDDMVKAGAIKTIGRRIARGGLPANIYAVAIRAAKAPVQRRADYTGERGALQQQMWTAMRTLGGFTLRELAASASLDERPVALDTAKKYVRQLANAGVLQLVQPCARGASPGHGATGATWRLRKSADTGPAALRVFRASIVFDANRGAVVGESEVSQ